MGGIARRATYIKSVVQERKNVVVVDAGDVFGSPGLLGLIKAEVAVEAMKIMSYDVFNVSDKDFNYGVEFLLSTTEQFDLSTVGANVVYEDNGGEVTAPYTIVQCDGFKVGFVGVVSQEYEETLLDSNALNEKSIVVLHEAAVLQTQIDEIQDEVDVVVVLAHVGMEKCTTIAEETAGIDVIVCGHGEEVTEKPQLVGGAYIVKAGYDGMYIGKLVLALDRYNTVFKVEGEITILDESIDEDSEVRSLLDEYHARLEEYKGELFDIEQKDPEEGWYYNSYASCEGCHARQTDHWYNTDHAGAFEAIIQRSQDYNPECIPCHTTGFGYTGGFIMPELTPGMEGVQCDMCHGAGGEHSETKHIPFGRTTESTCTKCHTPENSPQFDYPTYYLEVVH